MRPAALFALLLTLPLTADVSNCSCDPARPETLKLRECSLCSEAEKQPAEPPVFFVKDISPAKPNRWLALPRAHGTVGHPLSAMSAGQRLALWTGAIEKAQSLWGGEWGVAINGVTERTQCHTHIHIGKFLKEAETERFVLVTGPAEIPTAPNDSGVWVHPVDGRLHVHMGEDVTETVLLR
jgi:hypothetical protein